MAMTPVERGVFAFLGRLYGAYARSFSYLGVLNDGSLFDPRRYPFGNTVFTGCERDTLAYIGLMPGSGFTVLVALGKDGDRTAAFLGAMGCRAVRGSSLRGGYRAARDLLRDSDREEGPTGIIVDGPLGPAGVAKGGAVALALRTGRPIRALGVATWPRFVFPGTWSGIYLPLPFARVVVAVDDPLPLPEGEGARQVDELSAMLSERFDVMRSQAQGLLVRRARFPRLGRVSPGESKEVGDQP